MSTFVRESNEYYCKNMREIALNFQKQKIKNEMVTKRALKLNLKNVFKRITNKVLVGNHILPKLNLFSFHSKTDLYLFQVKIELPYKFYK